MEESPSPCMIKPPSPSLDVAEALGGLATTVTKLCIVSVVVESDASKKLSDTVRRGFAKVTSRSKHTIRSQHAARARERGDAIPKQHRRAMFDGQRRGARSR